MTKKIFVRSAYNYDADEVSNETGLFCADESLAQQHQRDEADINTIVRRFGLTGELPENVRVPQYGDFTHVQDYHSAVTAVMAADRQFMALPAALRSRFNNSAEEFVDFCLNPANGEELIKLGLAVERAPEPAQPPKAEPEQPPKAEPEPHKST